jgi:phosphotriesterase-related protein
MKFVNTLMGAIPPQEMGITAIHEYIMLGFPGWEYDPNFWFDIRKMFQECYNELLDFKLQGGRTYVDCSGIGMGRELNIYIKLAQATQVNLVVSTGFWSEDGVTPYFHNKDDTFFEELFVREINHGIGHKGVKAGIISVGNDKGEFNELDKTLYRAAGRAGKHTGAAVISHGFLTALKQLEILSKEGLSTNRIIISHLDSQGYIDIERDKEIARAGAYVSYDQVGIEDWSKMPYRMPDEKRVELILAMLDAGFKDRILLSTSSKCQKLGWGENHFHNVGHLIRYFLSKLKRAGVSDAIINEMLLENPRKALPIQKVG